MKERKVILYIACSLDGFITKPGDDLTFLDRVQKEGEDYGYMDFISTVDTVIIGRKTYDWVMGSMGVFPHADKETYVITRTRRPNEGRTVFYNGSLSDLVRALKKYRGKNIFCDGGAEVVNALLEEKLIDELILSIIPVLVGSGKRLFTTGRPEQGLELTGVKSFDTGLVQLYYRMNR